MFAGTLVLKSNGIDIGYILKSDVWLSGTLRNAHAFKDTCQLLNTYDYVLSGKPDEETIVPSKSLAMLTYTSTKEVAKTFNESLLKLNEQKTNEKKPYKELIAQNIYNDMPRHLLSTAFLFGKHPLFILSSKQQEIYLWLVFYKGVYMLMWSDDANYLLSLDLPQKDVFSVPYTLKGLLVLQPMYLITKFNATLASIKNKNNRVLAFTFALNYLNRQVYQYAGQ